MGCFSSASWRQLGARGGLAVGVGELWHTVTTMHRVRLIVRTILLLLFFVVSAGCEVTQD